VETIISTTELDSSKADTIISAFPTSFFGAEIIISAAEKPPSAVPAGVFLTVNQQLKSVTGLYVISRLNLVFEVLASKSRRVPLPDVEPRHAGRLHRSAMFDR